MKTKLMLLADHYNRKSSLNISLMNGYTVIRVMIYVTQIVKSLWMNSHLITGRFDVNMTDLLRVTVRRVFIIVS
jgi:hypothetical protein